MVDHTIDDKVAFVCGVAVGATVWFALLAWGVSRGHGRISPRALLRMEHVSGALMLLAVTLPPVAAEAGVEETLSASPGEDRL